MEFELWQDDPLRTFFENTNWPKETKRLEEICHARQVQLAKEMNVTDFLKTPDAQWAPNFKTRYDTLTREKNDWIKLYRKFATSTLEFSLSHLSSMENDIMEIFSMCQDPEVLGIEKGVSDVLKVRRKFVEKIGAIRTCASSFLTLDVVLSSESQKSMSFSSTRLGEMLIFSMYRTALARSLTHISHSPLFRMFFHTDKDNVEMEAGATDTMIKNITFMFNMFMFIDKAMCNAISDINNHGKSTTYSTANREKIFGFDIVIEDPCLYPLNTLAKLTFKKMLNEGLNLKISEALVDLLTKDRDERYKNSENFDVVFANAFSHNMMISTVANLLILLDETKESYHTLFEKRWIKTCEKYFSRIFEHWNSDQVHLHVTQQIDTLKSIMDCEVALVEKVVPAHSRDNILCRVFGKAKTTLVQPRFSLLLTPIPKYTQHMFENENVKDHFSSFAKLFQMGTEGCKREVALFKVSRPVVKSSAQTKEWKEKETAILLSHKKAVEELWFSTIFEHFRAFLLKHGEVILKVGEELVQQKKELFAYVKQVLELSVLATRMQKECFEMHEMAGKSIKAAFEKFFNTTLGTLTPAEMLASYFDLLLKAGKGRAEQGFETEEQAETALEHLGKLLCFIFEKDRFHDFYRKMMAKRLLTGKSESEDMEKKAVSVFKAELGAPFTLKLEGMLKDMQLSKIQNDQYTLSKLKGFTVNVIQGNNWPTPPTETLKLWVLTDQLHPELEKFTENYTTKNAARKLVWHYGLSMVTIRAKFGERTYEISMGMYQYAIMMLFKTKRDKKITIAQITEELNLAHSDVKASLASLVLGKQKLLLKNPASPVFSMTDEISINEDFSDKMVKIKIPNVSAKMSSEETTKTNVEVERDRAYKIEAGIVRIMKARKTLSHSLIISETIQAFHNQFIPSVPMIKKQIDGLLDKEYIKRHETEQNIFEYVA
jgi:hypothetical protein